MQISIQDQCFYNYQEATQNKRSSLIQTIFEKIKAIFNYIKSFFTAHPSNNPPPITNKKIEKLTSKISAEQSRAKTQEIDPAFEMIKQFEEEEQRSLIPYEILISECKKISTQAIDDNALKHVVIQYCTQNVRLGASSRKLSYNDWFWESIIRSYLTKSLNLNYHYLPESCIEENYFQNIVISNLQEENPQAIVTTLDDNHYVLFFIDPKNKQIEYYNSCREYGRKETFILEKIQRFAHQINYQFVNKTAYGNALQKDAYDCGPWVCFFAEERAKNLYFDPSKISPHQAPMLSRNQRLKVYASNILHPLKV